MPVFLEELGEHFKTTRFAIEEALAFHKKNMKSAQLEIETWPIGTSCPTISSDRRYLSTTPPWSWSGSRASSGWSEEKVGFTAHSSSRLSAEAV